MRTELHFRYTDPWEATEWDEMTQRPGVWREERKAEVRP